MNRTTILRALLLVCISPILATAQEPVIDRSEEIIESESVRPVASLTTADMLNPQDYAPRPVKPTPPVNRGAAPKASKGTAAVTAERPVAELMSTIEREVVPLSEPAAGAVTSTGNPRIDALLHGAAARNGVDPRLLLAVMRQESSFNARAVSNKGARGLMQLMPATARRFGVQDIFDPAQNIEGGAQYLRFLLDTFGGDVELALAGYNAGENAVARYGNRVPPYRETQDYVRRISAHYQRLTNGQLVRVQPQPSAATKRAAVKQIEVELVGGMRALTQQ